MAEYESRTFECVTFHTTPRKINHFNGYEALSESERLYRKSAQASKESESIDRWRDRDRDRERGNESDESDYLIDHLHQIIPPLISGR